jgi:glycolate oxidase iron-sulfur subunit
VSAVTGSVAARPGILGLEPDELVACVACGLCLPHCPTYRVTGLEIASPRGRIAAMRAVDRGEAPVDAAFARAMEECVQCRGCEAACPSGVPFGHLMERTRAALHSPDPRTASGPRRVDDRILTGKTGWSARAVEWLGYRLVLPHHWVLMALSWLLWLGQRLGLAGRLTPRGVAPPRLSARSLAARLRADADPDVVLFTGCVMDAWQRDVHRAAMTVLRATGARVGLPGPGASCCGALHLHAGRPDEARRLARRVLDALPPGVPVVVDSAGCGAALQDYGRLLGTDTARDLSARVYDFSEWVVAHGGVPTRPTGRTVVVQDPCHLRHVQGAAAAVHDVLRDAYDVRAPADDGLCCGAGGVYAAREPDLAQAIRARKFEAIVAAAQERPSTGSPLLVASANPGCALHLGALPELTVRHPAELLADALDRAEAP